jgi:hypothetical protein
MKTTRLLLALAMTVAATAASAAPPKQNTAAGTSGGAFAAPAHGWLQASDRELQQERARQSLDHQGFPQYDN